MKKSRLPSTDSIRALAEFWDTHDVTDFEDELEEAGESIFEPDERSGIRINVPFHPREAIAIEEAAEAKGMTAAELVRAFVLQQLAAQRNGG